MKKGGKKINKRIEIRCKNCDKKFLGLPKRKFCNSDCYHEFQIKNNVFREMVKKSANKLRGKKICDYINPPNNKSKFTSCLCGCEELTHLKSGFIFGHWNKIEKIRKIRKTQNLGIIRSEENKKILSEQKIGFKNPSWIENRDHFKQKRLRRKYIRKLINQLVNLCKENKNIFIQDLGYDSYSFKLHIESQFFDGMTWDNYGRNNDNWQIDHIKPVGTFSLDAEFSIINALNNLRPLWKLDNLKRPKNGSDI